MSRRAEHKTVEIEPWSPVSPEEMSRQELARRLAEHWKKEHQNGTTEEECRICNGECDEGQA